MYGNPFGSAGPGREHPPETASPAAWCRFGLSIGCRRTGVRSVLHHFSVIDCDATYLGFILQLWARYLIYLKWKVSRFPPEGAAQDLDAPVPAIDESRRRTGKLR